MPDTGALMSSTSVSGQLDIVYQTGHATSSADAGAEQRHHTLSYSITLAVRMGLPGVLFYELRTPLTHGPTCGEVVMSSATLLAPLLEWVIHGSPDNGGSHKVGLG